MRARRERPRHRRAAKNRYKVAAVHSIGASARASKLGGANVMNSRRFMPDLALPLVASPASACHPASLIFTRASSIICPALG